MSDNNKKVPATVEDVVRLLLDTEGGFVHYIGEYNDMEAYAYCFPKGTNSGYPVVVLYHREADYAYEVEDEEALDIIATIRNR